MSQSVTLAIGDVSVRQLDGLFSLNDLHAAAGGEAKHRPGYFLDNEQTKALTAEIDKAGNPAFKTVRGRYASTYACRELVIAYAAWISAAFHLKVIRVFLAQQATAPHQPALPFEGTDRIRISPQQIIGLAADLSAQVFTATVKQAAASGKRTERFMVTVDHITRQTDMRLTNSIASLVRSGASGMTISETADLMAACAEQLTRQTQTTHATRLSIGA